MGEYADSLKKKAGKATDAHDRAKSKNQSESVQAARKVASAAKQSQAANETAWKNSLPYLDSSFKGVGSNFYTAPSKGGTGNNGNKGNKDKKDKVEPRPNVSVSQVQIPLGSGQAITPNIQEAYIKEIERLTLNLISSADGLLFAYNFTSIDRIASYMLEADDASQRSTSVVSNIIRSRSDVELSELQIRDRLNDVINLVANTIGDLVPSSTKLTSFGMKKDNLAFQGGMPRIDNRTSFYDLELKLPELQGFGYDVTYKIECYDVS